MLSNAWLGSPSPSAPPFAPNLASLPPPPPPPRSLSESALRLRPLLLPRDAPPPPPPLREDSAAARCPPPARAGPSKRPLLPPSLPLPLPLRAGTTSSRLLRRLTPVGPSGCCSSSVGVERPLPTRLVLLLLLVREMVPCSASRASREDRRTARVPVPESRAAGRSMSCEAMAWENVLEDRGGGGKMWRQAGGTKTSKHMLREEQRHVSGDKRHLRCSCTIANIITSSAAKSAYIYRPTNCTSNPAVGTLAPYLAKKHEMHPPTKQKQRRAPL